MNSVYRWFLAAAIFAALIVHAVLKGPGQFDEMLWVCHIASFLMAIGIGFQLQRLVAVSLLFHVALGFPGYLLDAVVVGTTTLSSVLVHLVPLIAGAIYLRQDGLPEGIVFPCMMLYPVSVLVSRVLTPPALNVNLAYAAWSPVARLFPCVWMLWGFNLVASVVLLMAAERMLRTCKIYK